MVLGERLYPVLEVANDTIDAVVLRVDPRAGPRLEWSQLDFRGADAIEELPYRLGAPVDAGHVESLEGGEQRADNLHVALGHRIGL